MRKCVLGVFLLGALAMAGGFVFLKSGAISFRANVAPSAVETKLATMALNASVARHAPKQANPYPPSDENLRRGLDLYRVGCSECHGVPRQQNPYGASFYPPVPQFPVHPPQRSEAEIYYVVKNGIVYDDETLDEVWPRQRKYGPYYWQVPDALKQDDKPLRP